MPAKSPAWMIRHALTVPNVRYRTDSLRCSDSLERMNGTSTGPAVAKRRSMTHGIHVQREPCVDETLPAPAQIQAWEDEGGPARAAADSTAQVRLDRRAAGLDHRTPMVIQPNHAGERVRAVLSLGIATSAIIGLSWTYAMTAPQVERATTGVRSDNPESSSDLAAGGLRIFRLSTLDDERPGTATLRLHGGVEKGRPAYTDCGPEGDVTLLGPW